MSGSDGTAAVLVGPAKAQMDAVRSAITRIVTTRTGVPRVTSNGTATSETTQIILRTPPVAVSDFRVAYSNWYLSGSGFTLGPNPITIKAAAVVGLLAYPLTFNGQRTPILSPGATIWSDPISLTRAAAAGLQLRQFVSVNAGERWPQGRGMSSSFGDSGSNIAVGGDFVDGGGTTYAGVGQAFGPSSVIGRMLGGASALQSWAIIGDSIAQGLNDSGDAFGNYGYLERALGINVPWINLSKQSLSAFGWNYNSPFMNTLASGYVSRAVVEFSSNDIYNEARGLATTQANLITIWNEWSLRGTRVYQTTLTPRTTSTDGWATVANQTISDATLNNQRIALNEWLRAGSPIVNGVAVAVGTAGAVLTGQVGHPLYGVLDAADLAETARNSGIWRAAYVGDGVHPGPTGAAAIASGLAPQMLAA